MPQHDTFKAWTWHEPGEPLSLTLEDHEMRPAEAGEVIVDTRAIGLNPVDWKFIAMESRLWQPGQIPGVDAAGVVIDAGPGVDHLAPGDRIAVHTSLARAPAPLPPDSGCPPVRSCGFRMVSTSSPRRRSRARC